MVPLPVHSSSLLSKTRPSALRPPRPFEPTDGKHEGTDLTSEIMGVRATELGGERHGGLGAGRG